MSDQSSEQVTSRRSFIAGAGAGVLGAGLVGGGVLASAPAAFAKGSLSHGDAAILRFLSAAEILETDLWQQYNELCGIQDREVRGGSGNKAFTKALSQLDSDMAQYVHDNTEGASQWGFAPQMPALPFGDVVRSRVNCG